MNYFIAKDFTAVLVDDITTEIMDFLNGGELPTGMNDTTITLIPKVRNPQRISQ